MNQLLNNCIINQHVLTSTSARQGEASRQCQLSPRSSGRNDGFNVQRQCSALVCIMQDKLSRQSYTTPPVLRAQLPSSACCRRCINPSTDPRIHHSANAAAHTDGCLFVGWICDAVPTHIMCIKATSGKSIHGLLCLAGRRGDALACADGKPDPSGKVAEREMVGRVGAAEFKLPSPTVRRRGRVTFLAATPGFFFMLGAPVDPRFALPVGLVVDDLRSGLVVLTKVSASPSYSSSSLSRAASEIASKCAAA